MYSLVYRVGSRTVKAVERPCLKNKTKQDKNPRNKQIIKCFRFSIVSDISLEFCNRVMEEHFSTNMHIIPMFAANSELELAISFWTCRDFSLSQIPQTMPGELATSLPKPEAHRSPCIMSLKCTRGRSIAETPIISPKTQFFFLCVLGFFF